ncbi:MAG: allantoinase AllB [Solirubrobacteraceae bacterium]
MNATTIVHGGTVVTPDGEQRLDIVVRDGLIAELCETSEGLESRRIDASGCVVLPGGIDMHTHLREPSKIDREGFLAGTSSAVAGGITSVGEMPQAQPLVENLETLAIKRELAETHSICDIALYAAAVGQSREEIIALYDAGVTAMKAYMCESSPGYPRLDDPGMVECMVTLAELGLPLIVHAENDELLSSGLARMAAARRTDPMAHAESRPPLVEVEAIARAVRFAGHTGARLHIAHVSTPGGAQIVRDAAQAGTRVTCETCPQYLLLDHSDLERLGTWARCAPSIRAREDVDRLWDYVIDGTIRAIGSDHSPYTVAEKEAGADDIFSAPLGLNVIQIMLPAVRDEAMNRRGMSLGEFARLSATGPAEVLGLRPRKGAIEVGADADLAIWDLSATWTVTPEVMFSKHPWTPLAGRQIEGRVRTTIRRGEVVFDDHTVHGQPGSGQFLVGRQLVPAHG